MQKLRQLFAQLSTLANKYGGRPLAFIKKFPLQQIIGALLAFLGIYLLVTSILAIRTLCGRCEKGPSLGWLGILNPVLGLASFADTSGAEFKYYILIPLILGILLTIIGGIMIILGIKKPPNDTKPGKKNR